MFRLDHNGRSYEMPTAPMLGSQVVELRPSGVIVHPVMVDFDHHIVKVDPEMPGDQHKERVQATELTGRGRRGH